MNDVWTTLKSLKKPIVMYGTGDGADRILSVCEEKGISISGFFASDGFVRRRSFHGSEVMSYSSACEKFGDFAVILGFGSDREEVMENIVSIAAKREFYVPDVPVAGDEIFDSDFYYKHKNELEEARELLYDEESRNLFDSAVNFKLTGRMEYFFYSENHGLFGGVLSPENYVAAVDCGAYDGDTAKKLISHCPRLKTLVCLEPDVRNYRRLLENTSEYKQAVPLNAAAYDRCGNIPFIQKSGRGAKAGDSGNSIAAITVDSLSVPKIDYIKYDVEGDEYKALYGSRGVILRDGPDLCVSLYHRSEDLFRLILYINSLCPGYKMHIRRKKCFPLWEINLYCKI